MADSIREALTAAVDKAEKDSTDALKDTPSIGGNEGGEADAIGGGSSDDTISNAGTDDSGAGDVPASDEGTAPIAPATPAEVLNAPASWTKEERAAWAGVPPAAQKAAIRREAEMQRAFQSSASARKRVEAIDRVTEQYRPLLDSYGTTLEAVLPPLLATRAALEVGTDQQKAQLVANICADFGVPIEALDDALAVVMQGAPRQRIAPPQKIDYKSIPELGPVFALAATIEQHNQTRAAAALQPLTTLPHYEAVRVTMADLIERARSEGRSIEVQRAYDLACGMHGLDVVPTAPAGGTSVSEAAAILARSRKAASSVSGAPQPTPARKPGEGSVADEVAAQFASARR